MPNRRGFLLSTAGAVAAAGSMGVFRPRAAAAASPPLTKFVDALPLPGTLKSVGTMQRPGFASGPLYNVPVTELTQKLHRDLPATKVWGYGGSYPGPTIAAQSGTTVYVRYLNNLPDAPHPLWSDASPACTGRTWRTRPRRAGS